MFVSIRGADKWIPARVPRSSTRPYSTGYLTNLPLRAPPYGHLPCRGTTRARPQTLPRLNEAARTADATRACWSRLSLRPVCIRDVEGVRSLDDAPHWMLRIEPSSWLRPVEYRFKVQWPASALNASGFLQTALSEVTRRFTSQRSRALPRRVNPDRVLASRSIYRNLPHIRAGCHTSADVPRDQRAQADLWGSFAKSTC